MKLRPATLEDSNFLLRLKNDKTMRKFAIVTHEKIQKDNHERWLAKNLGTIRIAYEKEPIGMLRLSNGEISINIAAKFRKQGFGTKMLKGVKGYAKIVDGNVASLNLFLKAGFKVKSHKKNYYVLSN